MTINGPVYSRGTLNGANTVKAYNSQKQSKALNTFVADDMNPMHIPDEGHRLFKSVDVTSGTSVLVSGVVGRIIEVDSYDIVASGACNVTFLSNSTNISGPMSLAANGSINCNGFSLQTARGESLSITLSASAVRGHLSYRLV